MVAWDRERLRPLGLGVASAGEGELALAEGSLLGLSAVGNATLAGTGMHMAESNPEDLGKQSGVGNGAAEAETSARETKLNYEGSSKHGQTARGTAKGFASAEPKDGQVALNNSLQVKATSPRRIGVDLRNQEFVVFDETYPGKGIFHGHVRSWHELTPEMQQTLIKADKVTKKGKIIGD